MSEVITYPICLEFGLYPHPFGDNTTLLKFPEEQKECIERGIREDFVSILSDATPFRVVINNIRWKKEKIIVDGLLSDNRLSDEEDNFEFWLEVMSDKTISNHEAIHKGVSYMLIDVKARKKARKA